MIQEREDKHSHKVYDETKWVLIKLVDAYFTGEFQLNQIDACSICSVGGLIND